DPVACIAYQRRPDQDLGEGWDLVTYALSACNGKDDEFTKAQGRWLATDRLTNPMTDETPIDHCFGFNVERKTTSTEVVHFILDEIQGYTWAPSRVRRAARQWLAGNV